MTALAAVLDAWGVVTNDVTPQPVHLHSGEVRELQEAAALGVWPGSDLQLPGREELFPLAA